MECEENYLLHRSGYTPVVAFALFGLALGESCAAARFSGQVATLLVFGLWRQPGDLDGTTISVDGNEGEIAGVRVAMPARHQILGFDANTNLHRRAADVVHARLHDDEI